MTTAKPKSDKPTVIKKYANRRLYDTGRSSYVTLDDLCTMVKEGRDFVVVAILGDDRHVEWRVGADARRSDDGEVMDGTRHERDDFGLIRHAVWERRRRRRAYTTRPH